MPTALITGSSRGIGLEFARRYAEDGWRVIATCRDPSAASELADLGRRHADTVLVYRMDVGNHGEVDGVARALSGQPLDLLVSNAGWGEKEVRLGDVTYRSWEVSMRVNAYAPLKLAQAFLDSLSRGTRPALAVIGSTMGSIELNDSGTRYSYRASKAAANMIVRTLAADLAHLGIVVVSLHPGWVRTALGGAEARMSVHQSVSRMSRVIASLSQQSSGTFLNYDGEELPW